ncbi:MAG: molybdenum cofactor biosynthesis protein MoaE [Gammaproteobacteria bacterium]|nr:molybdenum cofactor biosynthesis protein MoaE [Gammaproteobacteria bacterium]
MTVSIRVQREDFSLADEWTALRARTGTGSGAIAAFAGLVREDARGGPTETLFLEHYPGMTESSIADIVREAEERWPLDDVVIVHRVGELKPGDQIVLVLVASGHRAAAFAACEFLMDYLKTRAVFWKKETRGAASEWIRSTEDDFERAASWSEPGAAGD